MLNSEEKTSMFYAFLKVKIITCRHEAFVINSGGVFCKQVPLIQELSSITCCQAKLLDKEMLGRRDEEFLSEHAESS